VWQVEYLQALLGGDHKAVDMTFGGLAPTQRKEPSRWIVRCDLFSWHH